MNRLTDMRDAIQATYRLVKGMDRRQLEKKEAVYYACQNRILVVAEAAKKLPASVRARHRDVKWADLIKMGDLLRH